MVGESSHAELGVRLIVSYDGTRFVGWAAQPDLRSVQGVLELAIGQMAGHPVRVRGCSRTDAGVHALGQVAAFDTVRAIPDEGWVAGINRLLDDDVAVVAATGWERGYEPRFDAIDKTYRYLLHVGPIRHPLLRHVAWHLGSARTLPAAAGMPLDLDAMRSAAQILVGTHDFVAFRAADDARDNTVRTMISIDVAPYTWPGSEDPLVAITVRGNAFMQHMVRIIAGTLVEVGRHKLDEHDMRRAIAPSAKREHTGPTAPAHGLTLLSIQTGRIELEASERRQESDT